MKHLNRLVYYFLISMFLSSTLFANTLQDKNYKSVQIPEGLLKSDWSNIQKKIKAQKYHAISNKTGGFNSSNPAHGWNTSYNQTGKTTLTPHNNNDANELHIGMSLRMVDGQELFIPEKISSKANIVTYEWSDNIKEWWVNSENNLEQWFSIQHKRANRPVNGKLKLNIDLDTEFSISQQGNNSILFTTPENRKITYNKLKVWDSLGKVLPSEMLLVKNTLQLVVNDNDAIYPLTIDPSFSQQTNLTAHNADSFDMFGASVAISGDTLIVGAPSEQSNIKGVNSDGSNNAAQYAGAAYVFVRTDSGWSQQAYLKASNTNSGDFFGGSVAISGDTVVIGAAHERSNATGVNGDENNNEIDRAGAAYIFTRVGSSWSQQAYLKASNTSSGSFGSDVAVSGDTVVVGSAISGQAYVFTRTGLDWSQQANLNGGNSVDGDHFGNSVAISGNTLVVGAPWEDSSDTGVNGDSSLNDMGNSGAAYVFTRTGSTWSQQAYLKASNTNGFDLFGESVAISGDTLVVGAPSESSNATGVNGDENSNASRISGAAYVFTRLGSSWSQQAYLKASNTSDLYYFGGSVAISDDSLIIGSRGESSDATGVNGDQHNNNAARSGAAYLFVRSGLVWVQQAHLKSSITRNDDYFGTAVAVSSDYLLVGKIENYLRGIDPPGEAYVFNTKAIIQSTAPQIHSGNTYTNTLDEQHRHRYYQFTLTERSKVTIDSTATVGLETAGWVTDSSGSSVSSFHNWDNVSHEDRRFKMSKALSPGTYYFDIFDPSRTEGDFTFTFDISPVTLSDVWLNQIPKLVVLTPKDNFRYIETLGICHYDNECLSLNYDHIEVFSDPDFAKKVDVQFFSDNLPDGWTISNRYGGILSGESHPEENFSITLHAVDEYTGLDITHEIDYVIDKFGLDGIKGEGDGASLTMKVLADDTLKPIKLAFDITSDSLEDIETIECLIPNWRKKEFGFRTTSSEITATDKIRYTCDAAEATSFIEAENLSDFMSKMSNISFNFRQLIIRLNLKDGTYVTKNTQLRIAKEYTNKLPYTLMPLGKDRSLEIKKEGDASFNTEVVTAFTKFDFEKNSIIKLSYGTWALIVGEHELLIEMNHINSFMLINIQKDLTTDTEILAYNYLNEVEPESIFQMVMKRIVFERSENFRSTRYTLGIIPDDFKKPHLQQNFEDVTVGVRGTSVVITGDTNNTDIKVLEGIVDVSTMNKNVTLNTMESFGNLDIAKKEIVQLDLPLSTKIYFDETSLYQSNINDSVGRLNITTNLIDASFVLIGENVRLGDGLRASFDNITEGSYTLRFLPKDGYITPEDISLVFNKDNLMEEITVTYLKAFSLDIDGEGQIKPLTDGLLILRSLFGFTGDSLISNAVGNDAARNTPIDIQSYIQTGVDSDALDIDGNGEVKPLTDGLLVLRYLFGFRGDSLIQSAVGENATRPAANDVEPYLEKLMGQ